MFVIIEPMATQSAVNHYASIRPSVIFFQVWPNITATTMRNYWVNPWFQPSPTEPVRALLAINEMNGLTWRSGVDRSIRFFAAH